MKLKNVFAFLALTVMMMLFSAAGCVQTVTGELETPDNAVAIALSDDGNTVYIADATKGLRIIDVSDIADPIETGAYEGAQKAFKVASKGNFCFIGDYMSGIKTVNTVDPDAFIVNKNEDSILPASLKIMGDFLFSGDIKDGLKSFHINSTSPYLNNTTSCPDTDGIMAMDISVMKQIACVVENQKGLMMIDISDPSNMRQTGAVLSTIKNANDIEVVGEYVYVATSDKTQIVDISNINEPAIVGDFGDMCINLFSLGNDLYCANGEDGLSQWDISSSTTPNKTMSRKFGSSKPVIDVVVSGDYAYLACESGGLVITDITQ